MSVTPISNRNDSARILTDGWSCTNFESGPDANSMTPTAMTTATIMMMTSSTMPTAVSTESSEKTMSSRTICTSTPRKEAVPAGRGLVRLLAFERLVDLARGLPQQEEAAADEDHVAPRELVPGNA